MQRMDVQENVRRVVTLLMADAHITSEQLAVAIGISAESLRSKKTGRRPWTLEETCALADYFGVSILHLVTPPEWELLAQARAGAHEMEISCLAALIRDLPSGVTLSEHLNRLAVA